MSENIAKQATEANDAMNIKNPELGWIIGFLFLVSFVGLFALVPMRKVSTCYFNNFLIYSMQNYLPVLPTGILLIRMSTGIIGCRL